MLVSNKLLPREHAQIDDWLQEQPFHFIPGHAKSLPEHNAQRKCAADLGHSFAGWKRQAIAWTCCKGGLKRSPDRLEGKPHRVAPDKISLVLRHAMMARYRLDRGLSAMTQSAWVRQAMIEYREDCEGSEHVANTNWEYELVCREWLREQGRGAEIEGQPSEDF